MMRACSGATPGPPRRMSACGALPMTMVCLPNPGTMVRQLRGRGPGWEPWVRAGFSRVAKAPRETYPGHMSDAYILDAVRTPRGRGKAGKGALSGIHPQELL